MTHLRERIADFVRGMATMAVVERVQAIEAAATDHYDLQQRLNAAAAVREAAVVELRRILDENADDLEAALKESQASRDALDARMTELERSAGLRR